MRIQGASKSSLVASTGKIPREIQKRVESISQNVALSSARHNVVKHLSCRYLINFSVSVDAISIVLPLISLPVDEVTES